MTIFQDSEDTAPAAFMMSPMANEQAPFFIPEPPHFPDNSFFLPGPENIQVSSHSQFPISLFIIHYLGWTQL